VLKQQLGKQIAQRPVLAFINDDLCGFKLIKSSFLNI